MTQTIKAALTTVILTLVASVTLLVAQSIPAHAQDPGNGAQCGSQIVLGEKDCTIATGTNAPSSRIEGLIKTIINIFSAVVGAVSVIMIIVGGFRYITSGGDSNNVGAAKNTILYAIVGLVIVAVAQIIVQFVLERTTS